LGVYLGILTGDGGAFYPRGSLNFLKGGNSKGGGSPQIIETLFFLET